MTTQTIELIREKISLLKDLQDSYEVIDSDQRCMIYERIHEIDHALIGDYFYI